MFSLLSLQQPVPSSPSGSRGVRPSDLHLPAQPPSIASLTTLTPSDLHSIACNTAPPATTSNSSCEIHHPIPLRPFDLAALEVILVTSAEKVFRNAATRDLIFGFLEDGRDLMSCVLVGKEGMVSACRRLYNTTVETASSKWLASDVPFDRFIFYSSCVNHIHLSNHVTSISQLPFKELLKSYPLVQSISSELVVDGMTVGFIRGTIDANATGAYTTLLIDMEIEEIPKWNMIKLSHPEYLLCRLNSLRVGGENPGEEMQLWNPVEWIGLGDIPFLKGYHCTAGVLSSGSLLTMIKLAPALKTLAFVHCDAIDVFTKRVGPLDFLENLRHLKMWSHPGHSLWDFLALPGLNLPKLETLQLHRRIHLPAGIGLEAVKAEAAMRTKVAVMSTIIPTKVIYPSLRVLDIWITDAPRADHLSFALQVAAMVRPGCEVSLKLQIESKEAEDWCKQAMVGLGVLWEVTSGRVGWSVQFPKRQRKRDA